MLPDTLQEQLAQHGIIASDESALRETLEQYVETYTLIKLAPWPARRWRCRYRLLLRDHMYDAQSASEAYALGLLAALSNAGVPQKPPPSEGESG